MSYSQLNPEKINNIKHTRCQSLRIKRSEKTDDVLCNKDLRSESNLHAKVQIRLSIPSYPTLIRFFTLSKLQQLQYQEALPFENINAGQFLPFIL
jgi:hypothetical protein